MAHTGSCFCGQAHYTITAEPQGARTCWCIDCQKIASGSATNNVLFPEDSVTFEGEITEIEKIADSGNTIRRGFCPTCGSQMYSRTTDPVGAPIRIRAGTLDNRELMAPQDVIFTASAPSWAVFDTKLPQHAKAAPAKAK